MYGTSRRSPLSFYAAGHSGALRVAVAGSTSLHQRPPYSQMEGNVEIFYLIILASVALPISLILTLFILALVRELIKDKW